jgi:hypothetical protein
MRGQLPQKVNPHAPLWAGCPRIGSIGCRDKALGHVPADDLEAIIFCIVFVLLEYNSRIVSMARFTMMRFINRGISGQEGRAFAINQFQFDFQK